MLFCIDAFWPTDHELNRSRQKRNDAAISRNRKQNLNVRGKEFYGDSFIWGSIGG